MVYGKTRAYGSFSAPRFSDGTGGSGIYAQAAPAVGYDPQAAAMATQQRLYLEDMQRRAKLEDDKERDRLGLNGVDRMLTSEYSPAYESVYEDVHGPTGELQWKNARDLGERVQVSVGGLDGSAPEALQPSVLSGRRMKRRLRPEYQQAFDRLGAPKSHTRSVEEMAAIEQAKADERIRLAQEQASLARERDALNNQSRVAVAAGRIQASDPTSIGKADTIANDMMTSATSGGGLRLPMRPYRSAPSSLAPQVQAQRDSLQAPSMNPQPMQGQTGEGTVLKQTAAGQYIQNADGTIIFQHNDGRVMVVNQ